MENRLFMTLFPEGNALFGTVKNLMADPNYALKSMLLNMAVVLMFIGLPLLFSMVVAWAGFEIGGVIATVSIKHGSQCERRESGSRCRKIHRGNCGYRLSNARFKEVAPSYGRPWPDTSLPKIAS